MLGKEPAPDQRQWTRQKTQDSSVVGGVLALPPPLTVATVRSYLLPILFPTEAPLPSLPCLTAAASSVSTLSTSPNAQVTQGIILITPSFLGSLLGTQGAEQCTVSLYFGHSPKRQQAHPNPPATLSISYFAQCGHLLERADSHTPCQALLTWCTPACPPAHLMFLEAEGIGKVRSLLLGVA